MPWARRCEAVMAYHRLVTPTLLAAVRRAGPVFVWTVDEAEPIRRLTELSVDGAITNDPRLFAT